MRTNTSAEAVVAGHRRILSAMLAPKSVALIRASEKLGSAFGMAVPMQDRPQADGYIVLLVL
jgi:hypothetical protein